MVLELRQEREKRGWTLEYVALQIGVATSTVQMMETSQRKPSFEVLIKILKLYNFPHKHIEQLFGVVGEEK